MSSGSWLTASAQGRGLGVEMRAAVLHLAFAGLGALEAQTSAWVDNPASQRVSLRLGYEHEGQQLLARRGEPTAHLRYRLTREAWQQNRFDGIEIHDSSPACRFSALHELAANLYNHATMATPTTQPSGPDSDAGSLSAGIAGASGYAGRELARLLAGHPQLSLQTAQARSEGFDALSPETLARCDVAFLCLPHGASRPFGEAIASAGTVVVDLGSDFRLDPDWAYGLTELFRQDVLDSRQIANPGCYATAATLALAPLAEAGLLDAPVAIDGKSGISGAGREPTEFTHVSEIEGGVQPYKPTGHRHIAEIERSLARLAGEAVPVTFTPHYAPHSRGLEVRATPACAGRSRRQRPTRSTARATTPSRSSPSSSACTRAGCRGPTAAMSESGSTSARRPPSAPRPSTTSSRARPDRRSRTPISCSAWTREPV